MNIRQFVIFGVVIGFLLQSCGKIPETNYFSDHDHIIKPTPTKLSGTKLIDNLIGASKIEIVDSLIALISPRNEKMISVYDLRSEEHTSELQSRPHLVCRLLLEKKKK